ncbi:unnamed protein product [Prunus brigantina]
MMKLRAEFLKTPFDSRWCHLFSSWNWREQCLVFVFESRSSLVVVMESRFGQMMKLI